jgi:hypothetical protein
MEHDCQDFQMQYLLILVYPTLLFIDLEGNTHKFDLMFYFRWLC